MLDYFTGLLITRVNKDKSARSLLAALGRSRWVIGGGRDPSHCNYVGEDIKQL